MNSYEVHGLRVSSSAVRDALGRAAWRTPRAAGPPYCISGHVVHGRKLGRDARRQHPTGGRTLNLRFSHWKPAASGIFAVLVHGLGSAPLPGVANLGIRPSLGPDDVNGGRVLLETHCLQWPQTLGADGGYGKIIRVELLHKLHDELKYDSLDALTAGIARTATMRARFLRPCTRKPTARPRATEFRRFKRPGRRPPYKLRANGLCPPMLFLRSLRTELVKALALSRPHV
jgi:riboflavin kinase/FMN adenylyltransferase